ncbi:cytotoxic and regulatory T-cell molecule-like isoform X2 [Apostichopus japonicus]|uniref:cytotoxic and regulatory T-cell molecule-like isoform X2 n=1 Tax=Stichopus japonicus TaxID=307972 RepID=UPI003AB79E46
MEIYCLIIFLIFFNCAGFHGFHNTISVRVVERDSVILECNDNATKGNKWYLDDQLIYANTIVLYRLSGFHLSNNYSLSISDVTFNHQGLYRCIRYNTHVVSYNVTTEVIPELTLSFDEITFSEPRSTYDHVVIAGEPLEITCLAVGSRPPASLTWVVNGEDVDPPNVHNVPYKQNKEKLNTTDSESALHLLPTGTHVNISCQFKGIELVSLNLTINFIFFGISDISVSEDDSLQDYVETKDSDLLVWSLVAVISFLLILLAFTCGIFISRNTSQCSTTDVSTINNEPQPLSPSAQIMTTECHKAVTHGYFTDHVTSPNDNQDYQEMEQSNENYSRQIYRENPNCVYYKKITS